MSKKRKPIIPVIAELPDPEIIDVPSLLESYNSGSIDIICVLGPTASGKTRYAVALAREINELCGKPVAEIISADSRQVYRGMDIGTGKDLCEYGEIPYHMIDIEEAGTRYTLFEYQRDFEKAYADIKRRECIPILCGGTGLYIQAAIEGYSLPQLPPDYEKRDELESKSFEELAKMLSGLRPESDPYSFDSKRRLVRAIEIAEYENEHTIIKSDYKTKSAYYIGTLVSREVRTAKIDRRLDERIKEGMVDEVKSLLDKGVDSEILMSYGLEYKFVTQHLLGIMDLDTMRTLLANAIHQFAKRQMTWFRGMEKKGIKIHWTEV